MQKNYTETTQKLHRNYTETTQKPQKNNTAVLFLCSFCVVSV